MKYPILEIFQSIQGEGLHTGRPVNFIRLAGCPNNCKFCDTNLKADVEELTPDEIIQRLNPTVPIVITGGEPLMHKLKMLLLEIPEYFHIWIETSGAVVPPEPLTRLDWISLSPKKGHPIVFGHYADEVKWLVPEWKPSEIDWGLGRHHFLQPVNGITLINRENLRLCLQELMLTNVPRGKTLGLSVQLHKLLGVR